MLWTPVVSRKTRSGAIFAEFLTTSTFSAQEPLAAAVLLESDAQGDHEQEDDLHTLDTLNDLDDIPSEPSDPYNDVDDLPPPKKKQKFDIAKQPLLKGSHRRRAGKRRKETSENGHTVRPSTSAKYVHTARPLKTDLAAETLPTAHGAYAGTTEDADEMYGKKKPRTVEEFLKRNFQLVKWNGYDAKPLADATGRVFGVLAGQPSDPTYAATVALAYAAVIREGAAARFPASMRKHRRGLYAVINVGISYGQGQTAPAWLQSEYEDTAEHLLADVHVARMAAFASAAFATWAPRLHAYYVRYNKHYAHLRRPFPSSVFSCAAFNFGPNVWTFKHRDVLNLPFGWCAIQALGKFDPTKGGHLILWDLKLIIEFPPGSLILIPSATLSHSNIPVQKGDERASFTQFTPGGLFRFADNGFRTEEEYAEEDAEGYEKMLAGKEARWAMGLGLWSTVDELLVDQ